jgi:meso-butanediol dehydrogenase/(S,S)-butanediol dehydrogenase/diacetyl reductase
MGRLDGKVALISGGARGMGEQEARLFAAEGARVVITDVLDDDGKQTAADIGAAATYHHHDVTRETDWTSVVDAVLAEHGQVDVLINNAGIFRAGTIAETSEADFQGMMAVNVSGYFYMAKAAMPELVKTRGSIVMTSSVSGIGGDWGMFAYNTSKGAVTNMVRAMALDAGKDGVRVNAVNPSLTDSAMTKDMQAQPELLAKFNERMPLGGPIPAEGIAAVMAFLASDDARYVTGVNLPVDAGLTASNGQPAQ